MSGFGWQDVVVAALVVAALAYLVWRKRKRPAKTPLVTLGRAPRRDGTPFKQPRVRGGAVEDDRNP